MAYVEIETPEGTRSITLERERLRIGRLATNDVVLAFPQVSRQHAELRHIKGQWWITDLGSTNGLQLDTRRIQDHSLRDGDRLMLAPGISIRFHDAPAAPTARPPTVSAPLWEEPSARPPRASRSHRRAAPPLPLASASAPPAGSGGLSPSPPASDAAAPFALWSASAARPRDPTPTVPVDPTESDVYASIASQTRAGRGYPVPHGPLHSGAPVGGDDLYRRAAGEAARPTDGPATLLHVCQTCGQRTAPEAIYCQHCHSSIANECPNCRLSLLPIQDRCPRCHTPNTHSVRRARARHPAP